MYIAIDGGGTAFLGGKGSIVGSIIGSIIMGMLNNDYYKWDYLFQSK